MGGLVSRGGLENQSSIKHLQQRRPQSLQPQVLSRGRSANTQPLEKTKSASKPPSLPTTTTMTTTKKKIQTTTLRRPLRLALVVLHRNPSPLCQLILPPQRSLGLLLNLRIQKLRTLSLRRKYIEAESKMPYASIAFAGVAHPTMQLYSATDATFAGTRIVTIQGSPKSLFWIKRRSGFAKTVW